MHEEEKKRRERLVTEALYEGQSLSLVGKSFLDEAHTVILNCPLLCSEGGLREVAKVVLERASSKMEGHPVVDEDERTEVVERIVAATFVPDCMRGRNLVRMLIQFIQGERPFTGGSPLTIEIGTSTHLSTFFVGIAAGIFRGAVFLERMGSTGMNSGELDMLVRSAASVVMHPDGGSWRVDEGCRERISSNIEAVSDRLLLSDYRARLTAQAFLRESKEWVIDDGEANPEHRLQSFVVSCISGILMRRTDPIMSLKEMFRLATGDQLTLD